MTAQEFRASFAEDFRRELADLKGPTVPSDDRCVVRFDDIGKLTDALETESVAAAN